MFNSKAGGNMLQLPNRAISVVELENLRRAWFKNQGMRYTRLAPRQALDQVIRHNNSVKEAV